METWSSKMSFNETNQTENKITEEIIILYKAPKR